MNAGNRVLGTIVGLLLLAAGVGGVLASLDRLPWIDSHSAVLPGSVDGTWRGWGFWAPLASIVLGVTLVVLGIVLMRAELRRHAARSMQELVLPDGDHGATRVGSRTLAKALTNDLARSRDIEKATAQLTGHPSEPALRLRLTVSPVADLGRIRNLVDRSLERFSATSGLQPRLADVEIRVANQPVSRVH